MYNQQVKELIKTLYRNLIAEQRIGSILYSINDPLKRASYLTGLSKSCIRNWIKQDTPSSQQQAEKRCSIKPPFKTLDQFEVDIILRKVQQLFNKKQPVSTRKLQKVLVEENDLKVSKSTLWKILKRNGFSFRRTNGNRSILCERPDLQISRCKFLRELKDARDLGMNIIYLDETWINSHHTQPKEWVSNDGKIGRIIPAGRGRRLILLHAVDESTGFSPDCQLLFQSHSTDGRDYHTEMNSTIFEDWIEHNLLPSIKEPACIVMDNASYHSRISTDSISPTSSTRKEDMKIWLRNKNIPFDDNLLKPELYELIRKNKPEKIYVTDQLIQSHGHLVLRLPPYHCDLNPIELLWGIIKNDVASKNSTFKLADMRNLTEQAIQDIPLETIKSTFEHTRKIEETYWENDGLNNMPTVSQCIVNLQDSSTDSDSSFLSSDENI